MHLKPKFILYDSTHRLRSHFQDKIVAPEKNNSFEHEVVMLFLKYHILAFPFYITGALDHVNKQELFNPFRNVASLKTKL